MCEGCKTKETREAFGADMWHHSFTKMYVRNAWLFRRTRLAVGAASGRNSCVGCQSVVCKDRLAIALVKETRSPSWCHPYCFADAFRRKRQPWWIKQIVTHMKLKIKQRQKYRYTVTTLQRKVTTKQHDVTKAKMVLTRARIVLNKTVRQLKASLRRTAMCEGCKTNQSREAFGADMWHNGQNKKRKMICLACAGRGKSLYDIGLYTCEKCGMTYGHQKFIKYDVGNHRRLARINSKTKLVCIDCKLK